MNTYKSKRNVSPLAKLIGVAITAIVALPIASAVVALGVLLQGWAIHLLWNWFIPPHFWVDGFDHRAINWAFIGCRDLHVKSTCG
jgi:hypothetical protein